MLVISEKKSKGRGQSIFLGFSICSYDYQTLTMKTPQPFDKPITVYR
jgi:hypothetical protein